MKEIKNEWIPSSNYMGGKQSQLFRIQYNIDSPSIEIHEHEKKKKNGIKKERKSELQ